MRRDRSETMTDQKKIIDELECRKKQLVSIVPNASSSIAC